MSKKGTAYPDVAREVPVGCVLRTELDGVIAVIPSLDPDEKLSKICDDLRGAGLHYIIIVNDGSRDNSLRFFPSDEEPGVTMLSHDINLGKGCALKTAFNYIIHNRPDCRAVITVDGDGQHAADDSVRVASHSLASGNVAIGVRDFSLPDVPNRSRVGNRFTSGIFRFIFGMKLSDTQTGLRCFPANILPLLTSIEGERFEYETNMLLELDKAGKAIDQVPIQTLYINKNETSHYRSFSDSMRVFMVAARFLKFSLSSLAAGLLDNAIFYVLAGVLADVLGNLSVAAAFTGARAVSSVFNFSLNRKAVFKDSGDVGRAARRYYLLVLVQFLAANALLNIIVLPLGLQAGSATAVKIFVDTMLFILSYHIQRKWVFGKC